MNVIGLISGTSVDGIDAVVVRLSGTTEDLSVELLAAATYPYPHELRSRILGVVDGGALSMAELAELDDAIATVFAQAAQAVQAQSPQPAVVIGSHGQTVYHRPPGQAHREAHATDASSLGYSLQLGRGAVIADRTGLTTISNFRAADIAVGGQGAPLVSPLDLWLLGHPTYDRCVQNIGGIGNVTYLPARSKLNRDDRSSSTESFVASGWDTGPGNALLDLAVHRLSGGQRSFDDDGAWAAQGSPCLPLVQQWLQDDYFQQLPPKSTGRELYSSAYLDRCLQESAAHELSEADLLATLTELTAASIAYSYRAFLPRFPDQVLLCGGGSRNSYLRQRLQVNLAPAQVYTTDEMGLNADYKEAIAFAVLAYWRVQGIPGNLPAVTGARQSVLLGDIHPPYPHSFSSAVFS